MTSAYFGQQFHAEAASAQRQATTARADADRANASLLELQEVLQPDTAKLPLDKAISKALLDVYNLRVANGITVSQVTPGRPSSGSVADLQTLTENVPGTSVGSVKVNMSGAYTSYEGLLSYVKTLQEGPVALTRLKVVDRTFELSLRIYGTTK